MSVLDKISKFPFSVRKIEDFADDIVLLKPEEQEKCLILFMNSNIFKFYLKNIDLDNQYSSLLLSMENVFLQDKKNIINDIEPFNDCLKKYIDGTLELDELKKILLQNKNIIHDILDHAKDGHRFKQKNIIYFKKIRNDFRKTFKLLEKIFLDFNNILEISPYFNLNNFDFGILIGFANIHNICDNLSVPQHFAFAKFIKENYCHNLANKINKTYINEEVWFKSLYLYSSSKNNIIEIFKKKFFFSANFGNLEKINFNIDININNAHEIFEQLKNLQNYIKSVTAEEFFTFVEKYQVQQNLEKNNKNTNNKGFKL